MSIEMSIKMIKYPIIACLVILSFTVYQIFIKGWDMNTALGVLVILLPIAAIVGLILGILLEYLVM